MPSRMERYANVNKTRTSKNRDLYDQIYEDKEYTNIEGIVKTPITGNIDIEKIREIINGREETNNGRERRVRQTPQIEQSEENTFIEQKNYDIKDVLDKAKGERNNESTAHHSLKNIDLNVLKELKINKEDFEENSEGLKELINTITSTSMLNKIGDKELSLDLLDDLKSNNNTIIDGSDAIRSVLKEQEVEQKQEVDEIDKSFYTKSLNLTDDLEGINGEKSSSKTSILLTRIFIIAASLMGLIIGFIIIYKIVKK